MANVFTHLVRLSLRAREFVKPQPQGKVEHVMPHVPPVQLANLLKQVPGKWVAMRNGEIVEARDTLDNLMLVLEEREIRNVTVMRSPAEGEVELVGLG